MENLKNNEKNPSNLAFFLGEDLNVSGFYPPFYQDTEISKEGLENPIERQTWVAPLSSVTHLCPGRGTGTQSSKAATAQAMAQWWGCSRGLRVSWSCWEPQVVKGIKA